MAKTMHKITTVLLVAACTVCSVFCGVSLRQTNTVVYAEQESITLEAEDSASTAGGIAMKALELLFGDDKGVIGVKSIFKNIFADIGYVNSAITFLKLIGVMKDATAEALAHIQIQLENITERLSIMDAKLDTIINTMSEIKSRQDFIDRTTSARDYRKYFQDFKRDYCTNGLNPLITQFESMQTDAMKAWYNAETSDARKGDIDNSYITLIYDVKAGDVYSLRYTTENGIPDNSVGKYIQLPEEYLPTKNDVKAWNVDTYRDEIKNFITDSYHNSPELIVEKRGYSYITDTMLDEIAEDAINLIIYRTAAEKINESSLFANTVLDAFGNYSYNLLRLESGFDAIIKALYYTHSFEYEISDTINELFAELVFETTYYGSFVKDVIAMSNDITQAKKTAFDESYCNALIKLDNTKQSALTGKPNYCYLTNTLLYYGGITMSANASIHTYADGPNDGYTSYAANGFTVNIFRYDETGKTVNGCGRNQLIGNDAASLISMTLRSNGIVANHDYLTKTLYGKSTAANCGATIVSLDTETNLPFDSSFGLKVQKVIGDYFSNGSTISLRNMPANTSSEYVHWHRMIQGSLFNFESGALASNSTVAAIALYGEHHWYWSDDESAFMSGTSSNVIERNYNQVCTKNYGKRQFENYYSMSTDYNCVLQEAIVPQLSSTPGQVNSLYSYREENNYVEPAAPDIPAAPETYSGAEKDSNKTIYNALTTLDSIYKAVIIIPCVFVGLAAIVVATFFIVRAYRKKKNK